MFKRGALFQAILLYGPILVGAWAAMLLPLLQTVGAIAFTAYVVGVSMFLYAKVCEKVRLKQPVSFGSRHMNRSEKILYFTGYAILTCGTILLVVANVGIT